MIPFTDKGEVRVADDIGPEGSSTYVDMCGKFRDLMEKDNESLRHLLGTIERGCSWAQDLRGWSPDDVIVVLLHCAFLVRQDKGLG